MIGFMNRFILGVIGASNGDFVCESVSPATALDHVTGADLKIGLGEHDCRDMFSEIANGL